MNRLSLVTYAVILFSMSCNNLENEVVNNSNENSAINKYKITSDEYIIWKARHMRDTVDDYISKLYIKNGEIIVSNNIIKSGFLCVDVGTMKLDKELPKNLIKHLISPGYFNLNAYPTIKFDINRVYNDSCFGELNVIGIKKKMNFPLQVDIFDDHVRAKSTIKLDMLKFKLPDLVKTHSKQNREEVKGPNNFIYIDVNIKAFK